MGPVIIKRRHNLKGRTRRILTGYGPVQKTAVILIIYNRIPVILQGIGIKVRFADHGQNPPGGRLHNHYSPLIISQGIIGCRLQAGIQGGKHAVSHIFHILKLILHLLQEERMRSQKLEIGL